MRFVASVMAMLAVAQPIFAQLSSSTGSSLSSSTGSDAPIITPNKPLTPNQLNDLAVLNTALSVAHLESSFFACQLSTLRPLYDFCEQASSPVTFSADDFAAEGFNATVYEAFEQAAFHSIEHVATLTQAITDLTNNASAAVPACAAYNYQRTGSVPSTTPQTITIFFAGAQALSASSTQIHLGALSSVTDPALLEVVAGLAAVEARHTSYFWQMAGFAPFSSAGFDSGVTMVQAGLTLRSWTLSCPGVSLVTPTIRPYGLALNTSNVTNDGYAQGVIFTGELAQANNLTYTVEQRTNDVLALNYMLFVEQVFQNLFNASSTQFPVTAWNASGFDQSVVGLVSVIAANENIHASVLRSMLVLYDDSALAQENQCVYNFSSLLVDPQAFVQALATLKQWSLSAYIGASSSMTDTGLQQLIGSMTTVEARHSAILNLIAAGNRRTPLTTVDQARAFPTAIDAPLTPADAYDQLTALGLVVSCSAELVLPGRAPLVIPSPPENNQTQPISSSTGAFFNQSSSSGAFVNQTSSTGAAGNFSSTGAAGNFSSTGAAGNFSSTGAAGNFSSTGVAGNFSSTGAFFNQSSTGSFTNFTSSSVFFNQSSTGAAGNFSSTGAFGNFSSTGALGNFSSTGSFNQTTGLSSVPLNATSSTGVVNRTSSSSSSGPFGGLSSSIRSSSSSSAASSSAASSSSVSASSSTGIVQPSSSSSPLIPPAPSSSSSPLFPPIFSSTADFDPFSSTGEEDVENPDLNGAASVSQSLSMVFAVIVAVGAFML